MLQQVCRRFFTSCVFLVALLLGGVIRLLTLLCNSILQTSKILLQKRMKDRMLQQICGSVFTGGVLLVALLLCGTIRVVTTLLCKGILQTSKILLQQRMKGRMLLQQICGSFFTSCIFILLALLLCGVIRL